MIHVQHTPDGYIPDMIQKEVYTDEIAKRAFLIWLNKGDYLPSDIMSEVGIVATHDIYIPFYYFLVEYEVEYSASVGYYERYRDRQGNTQTRTNWHPYSGRAKGTFSCLAHAGKDYSEIFDILAGGRVAEDQYIHDGEFIGKNEDMRISDIPRFCLSSVNTSAEATGTLIDHYRVAPVDFDETEAFKGQVRSFVNARRETIEKNAPGDTVKDITIVDDDTLLKPMIVVCPFEVFKYRYKGTDFIAILNKTNGKINGTKPFARDQAKRDKKKLVPVLLTGALSLMGFVGALTEKDHELQPTFVKIGIGFLVATVLLVILYFVLKSRRISRDTKAREEITTATGSNADRIFSRQAGVAEADMVFNDADKRRNTGEETYGGKGMKKLYQVLLYVPYFFGLAAIILCITGVVNSNRHVGNPEELKGYGFVAAASAWMFLIMAFAWRKAYCKYNDFSYEKVSKILRYALFLVIGASVITIGSLF